MKILLSIKSHATIRKIVCHLKIIEIYAKGLNKKQSRCACTEPFASE